MPERGPKIVASRDVELWVGEGLVERLRELAEAAAGLSGLERRLADRGFDALAEDCSAVRPPEVRAGFAAVCAEIRDEAARRSGSDR